MTPKIEQILKRGLSFTHFRRHLGPTATFTRWFQRFCFSFFNANFWEKEINLIFFVGDFFSFHRFSCRMVWLDPLFFIIFFPTVFCPLNVLFLFFIKKENFILIPPTFKFLFQQCLIGYFVFNFLYLRIFFKNFIDLLDILNSTFNTMRNSQFRA